nr:MAG TPA: hypothetical protein [Caudoviricetes sp.]DAS23958.1 MAG TPA: hypothetical protein [Caudoviricetes sp.]
MPYLFNSVRLSIITLNLYFFSFKNHIFNI